MKFLHMADVHLGAEPESGTPLGEIRKREIWEAFRDVIRICESEEVDLLLIPGDLFHGQPLLREVKEVNYLFGTLTKTRVVLIAGNHDCLLKTSHYYDVEFAPNVTFLMDPQEDRVFFEDLNTEVVGLSYETKQISEARYDVIRRKESSRISILLAHGNIRAGLAGDDRKPAADKSIPIHRAAIEENGFDYAALGHLHTRIEISERIAYSGGFEPLERNETGAKGYILGEITKEGAGHSDLQWNFVPHARREYVPITYEVTPEDTEFSVCERLWEKMTEQGLWHMYLITLSGKHARELTFFTERMKDSLWQRGGYVITLEDKSAPDFSAEELHREHQGDFIGAYLSRLEAETDRELAEKAMEYGLQALLAEE